MHACLVCGVARQLDHYNTRRRHYHIARRWFADLRLPLCRRGAVLRRDSNAIRVEVIILHGAHNPTAREFHDGVRSVTDLHFKRRAATRHRYCKHTLKRC